MEETTGLGEYVVSSLGFDPSHWVIWGQFIHHLLKIEYTILVSELYTLNTLGRKFIQNRNILLTIYL